ncbi:hypothetical protein ETU10_03300 [Apibacter muscae]|uniref:hypothetical protein n=1 Tax=Apibacter muscae TaxID=2509004 RepID=UPI0011AD7FDB|nr:hypothetical protein [Apibacter muscae]TWP24284.1 hypothetical protein ETU10_03300 [Apibacter muscae]
MRSIFYIIGAIVKFFLDFIRWILGINHSNKKYKLRKYSNKERYQFLENKRIRNGYKKGWLYYRCKEEGLMNEYYKYNK